MKIRIFFILFAISIFSAQAQKRYKHLYPGYYGNGSSLKPIGLRIGLSAGVAITDISRDLLVNPYLEDAYESVYQPNVGLVAQYALSSKIMLGSGLYYKPMSVNYKTNSDVESTLTNVKKNYLEVPVVLNVTFRKGEYQAYPAIYAGGSVSFLLNAEKDYESITLNTDSEPYRDSNLDITEDFNKIDLGPVVGISYYIPIQTNLQLMLDLKGYMGVTNINNLPSEANGRPYTINTSFMMSIALIWGR